ncbi:RNA methyltransferase [Alteromonas pelagimontana]|uniref:RNA methyltransferase n=1 Tax=Alteromonas pelagimontana TaxID=1858656 RepID=A0A6M4MKD7_9ALTE|nr:RNA methyltransferase [Alteromonas pelagimontana]QJR82536.1 RNA methyltransferase [Alteromonas pelagimontana]
MNQQHVSIGLINPKSATNVGAVLRAAGCYGASRIFYTGERYTRAKAFNADTKAVHKTIPAQGVGFILEGKQPGAKVIAVELAEGATPLPEYNHPLNAYYIFGPEDGSIPKGVLQQCDDVVYVPTQGCMNLAATVNVVLYDRLAKSDYDASDELIKASRDKNNRLKFAPKRP